MQVNPTLASQRQSKKRARLAARIVVTNQLKFSESPQTHALVTKFKLNILSLTDSRLRKKANLRPNASNWLTSCIRPVFTAGCRLLNTQSARLSKVSWINL